MRVLILVSFSTIWAGVVAGVPSFNPTVEGLLRLNGKEYQAVCNCNDLEQTDTEAVLEAPVCNPSKVKIHEDHGAPEGLSMSQVREYYGQPADVTLQKVDEQHFACMDDRVTVASLTAPGGDLGEFLLGTTVNNGMSESSSLTEELVTESLNNFLSKIPTSRKFYHCTDDAAIAHIERELNLEGLDIVEPPENMKDDIKAAFSEAENVGDMHLRSILRNPTWYHIDPQAAPLAMKAFFNILWDKANPNSEKLLLDILPGKRNPKAFLEIMASDECDRAGVAPLLQPRNRKASALINHMTAVNSRRAEIAAFFSKKGSAEHEQFRSRLDRYGFLWLETTGARVAKGIPFYRLTFV